MAAGLQPGPSPHRALRRTLHDCSPGAGPEAKFGAVSFLHRFGASLNPHFHYHLCVLDGVYEAAEEGEREHAPPGGVRFHEATALTRADVEALQETVRRRILRDHASRGARRRQGLLEEHTAREMLGWDHAGGFFLDASVRIPAHDRAGLERLLRYCARPPFALNRIEWRDSRGSDGEGVVLYWLPRPAPDGRTLIRLSPLDLLDRLAALVPPPRVHRHRYHGVLAPNSPLRSARSNSRRVSSRWAALVARIHHARPLVCPGHRAKRGRGESMRLIARPASGGCPTDPFSIRDVLNHLGEPVRPPPLRPARGPPELEFGFAEPSADEMDQTPAVDSAEPEPIPPYEMDQTRS